jgi:hypothetical protein
MALLDALRNRRVNSRRQDHVITNFPLKLLSSLAPGCPFSALACSVIVFVPLECNSGAADD